jgi:hypothetical protein
MADMKMEVKCGATCPDVNGGPDFVCELEEHSKFKKHRQGGVSWTGGGAERVRAEIAEKVRRAEIEKEPF